MYTGQLVQFPDEENLFVLLGVTRGRDGTVFAVMKDINKEIIKLIEQNNLPDQASTSSLVSSKLSTI